MPYFLRHWLFEYVGEPACEGGERWVKTSQEASGNGIHQAALQITEVRYQTNVLQRADDLFRWALETYHTQIGADDPQLADTSLDEIMEVYPQARADVEQIVIALSDGTVRQDSYQWLSLRQFEWLQDFRLTRRIMFATALARQKKAEALESAARIGQMRDFLMDCAEAKADRICLV